MNTSTPGPKDISFDPVASQPPDFPVSLRLPVCFDTVLLQTDLGGIVSKEFIPHFNTRYYEGDWSVVSLRSVGGRADQIYPDPTRSDYSDTPLMARCPYVAEVVDYFRCPKLAVRFLRVRPRSVVKEHRDHRLCLADGELRLHIPITTNPEVRFVVAGKRVVMGPGECWYHDFTQLHSVHNDGDGDRVHLTIDCVVNDWLRGELLVAAAAADGTTDMSSYTVSA
jgi:Aspartyl/Asparaginyl beta-hydroxylase